jgi:hypothetical protein
MLRMPLRRAVGPLAISLSLAAALVALGASSFATATATSAVAQERVTLIGDSAATAILWYPEALSILEQGLALQMQVAVCRRLTGESCPYEGSEAPTLLQLVAEQGPDLGSTVVVVMGYNDFAQTFARSVEASLTALRNAGVQRVVWATLSAARVPYLGMNDVLRAATERHPELTIADWNVYARSHPEWFQTDGIHLVEAGGIALATFLRSALQRLDSTPPQIVAYPRRPPVAYLGRRYIWHIAARGGVAPYRWIVEGALPRGIALRLDGTIAGMPKSPGDARIVLRAIDGSGRTAMLRTRLIVKPA